jgi:hypothetical protein
MTDQNRRMPFVDCFLDAIEADGGGKRTADRTQCWCSDL